MFELKLLGPFAALRDGIEIEGLPDRSAHRLIALLTLEHGRRVSRHWVEEALGIGYDGLRKALAIVRERLLREEADRLKVENNGIALDLKGVDVDIYQFEKLAAAGDLSSYRDAVRLYSGGLLRDWDEVWIWDKREEYLENYLSAMQTLTRAAINAGTFEIAASYLRRFTLAYPEMDSGWAQLIDVYRTMGDIDQAEKTFASYCESLEQRGVQEERDIPISPRVLSLIEGVRNRTAALPARPAAPAASAAVLPSIKFEAIGGAVPLSSPFYLERDIDLDVRQALQNQTSFVLLRGPRQVGKTSLLARALSHCRSEKACVVRTDWQNVSQEDFVSIRHFLISLAETICEQLKLELEPEDFFPESKAATKNFERFLRKQVLPTLQTPLVWAIDEVDRIFEIPFKDDVFAMLRSWHNERALDADCAWNRLSVIMAYATETYLISNIHQSPFNVGHKIDVTDFTTAQVTELNRRYGEPLRSEDQVKHFYSLFGGHPYLSRLAFFEMTSKNSTLSDVERAVYPDKGLFHQHLERLWYMLTKDEGLMASLRLFFTDQGRSVPNEDMERLCAAGVLATDDQARFRPRNVLYERFLLRRLA